MFQGRNRCDFSGDAPRGRRAGSRALRDFPVLEHLTGQTLTASDLTSSFVTVGQSNMEPSCLDGLGDDASQYQANADPFPGGTESLPATLKDELERLRFVIKKLTGWSQWYKHSEQLAIPNFNWTFNGDQEIWGAGTSAAPTGWTLTGAGATVAKNTTAGQFKIGTASVAITRVGADATLHQDIDLISGFGPAARWQGKTVTLGKWVRATVASRARIQLNDGVGTTSSSYHTGSSTLEFLTATRTLDGAATRVRIQSSVDTGDTTAQFDGAILVLGSTVSDFIPSGWRGRKTILNFGTGVGQTVAAASDVFLSQREVGGGAGQALPMPFKSVIRRMFTGSTVAPGAAQTFTYTFATGASNTPITTTHSGASQVAANDVVNEKEIQVGNNVEVRVVTSAGAAVTQHIAAVEVEEVP